MITIARVEANGIGVRGGRVTITFDAPCHVIEQWPIRASKKCLQSDNHVLEIFYQLTNHRQVYLDPTSEMSPHKTERFARTPHLWALGVGAVISGDFFGWQAGLVAGFLGYFVNLVLVSFLYLLLSFSIAELSTAIPCGGGPYVFASRAFGPTAACVAGLGEILKLVGVCAVVAVGIGSYMNQLMHLPSSYAPLWWLLSCVGFTLLNMGGAALSFRVQFAATLVSLVLLLVFYIGALPLINYSRWVQAQDWAFPHGVHGLFQGLAFTLWFFIGIEELPLAVEETIDPAVHMPRALFAALATLFLLACATLVCSSTIPPGAAVVASSTTPLLDGYRVVFGESAILSWCLLLGLVTSFHSFVFCTGRLLYAVARDGYLPSILATLHPTRHTPLVGLAAGAALSLTLLLGLHVLLGSMSSSTLAPVLMHMALLGALVSYAFQLAAFVRLRRTHATMPRPYTSPFGLCGAYICLGLVALVFATIVVQGIESAAFGIALGVAGVFFGGGMLLFWYEKTSHNKDDDDDDALMPMLSPK
ncbi:Aste57867_20914 [Aphanomyces stellatus]|uniref:Aste57867_20914 protein n=1 Tax=Aphanomyces stellatus TaxID=120398 RepID=A0A485LG97_9STRA|nr:hypothetical protein As57867_020846 [Aphanomyces stellatus]VFT97591.1 Aste57867_20914 [Aphanomyces stellatus]